MKLIAQIDNDKYFAEVSKQEIALMKGVDAVWELTDEFKVGDEISVEIISRATKILKRLDSDRIAVILRDLEHATQTVKVIQETTQALTLFNVIKDAE